MPPMIVVAAPAMRGGAGFGFDFACYYDAAVRFVAGEGLYLARTLEGPFIHGGPGTYVYAPPLAVALVPFTVWSFPDATMVWFAARVVLLALAIALMPVRATIRFATFGVVALSASLLSDLSLGNVNVPLLLGVVIGWRWLDRPVGAVALAATMTVRPQLAVIVAWWLLRRRWRLVALATTTGAAVLVATLPLVGIGAYTDFLRLLRNIRLTGAPHNVSLDALARSAGLAEPLATAAFLAGAMVAIGAVVASRRLDTEAAFVVVTSASLLLTPLLWPHGSTDAVPRIEHFQQAQPDSDLARGLRLRGGDGPDRHRPGQRAPDHLGRDEPELLPGRCGGHHAPFASGCGSHPHELES